MNTIISSFNNCIPSLPGVNPSKEPLNFGISLFAPVSSVPGSATLFFTQPVLTAKVVTSIAILIGAQIVLFIANHFFGLETIPANKYPPLSPDQTVQMSLRDLQDFLASMSRAKVQSSTRTSTPSTVQEGGEIVPESAEVPLVVALAVWGDFSNKLYSPSVFLLFPIFEFPGLRGSLPLLLLELLTTIFVRAVVPPQTTGSKPLMGPTSNTKPQSVQFSSEDLLSLLRQFSKHFGTMGVHP